MAEQKIELVETKMPFKDIVLLRILDELCIVDILKRTNISKEELIVEVESCIKVEKRFIKKLGVGEASKVYSYFYEGDVETAKQVVKHILTADYGKHYRKVLGITKKTDEKCHEE